MKHAIDPVSTVKTYVVYEMLSQTQEKMLQKENITRTPKVPETKMKNSLTVTIMT